MPSLEKGEVKRKEAFLLVHKTVVVVVLEELRGGEEKGL